MQKDMQRLLGHKYFILIVIGYTLLLTAGSLLNLSDLPPAPSNFDKVLHLGGYFALTLLWMFWSLFYKKSNQSKTVFRKLAVVALAAFTYGIFIELLQGGLTTYRTADGLDVVANTTGILLALGIVLVLINKTTLLKSKF